MSTVFLGILITIQNSLMTGWLSVERSLAFWLLVMMSYFHCLCMCKCSLFHVFDDIFAFR